VFLGAADEKEINALSEMYQNLSLKGEKNTG
jgi:hypothetical protein